ncbi:shikimate kinase [Neobacillus ginsengisoli]|uniref:Shikimate kinase n=1 Tax=Neobacillus ginsengisoli TaxID=904295 RepID=A0ABT9Y215_9BACI|nr:shikimate kinase [Neobacillus ginsengisoli]MDQ0201570.1 shikimate kinase [Neobacillus ginsengisoli]
MGEKSFVFIGFMGAGKTTIGKLVAKKLGSNFVDIDEEIEKQYQMPITQIFNKIGEKAFRDREKSLITSLAEHKQQILSVGGGAFLQDEVRNVCLSSCIVIYLNLSWESWKQRLSLLIESRPLLQGKSLDEMEELFNKRQEIYNSNHHYKIETDNLDIEEIADSIVEMLKLVG